MVEDGPMWAQASLPVCFGGLGFRSAVQLAPSAYLASGVASSDLIYCILPSCFQSTPFPDRDEAIALWSHGHDHPPPVNEASFQQKCWDTPRVMAVADGLLQDAGDAVARARLLAASTREPGMWHNVCPISSLGHHMDDQTIHVAVGLRLGAPLCKPHTCHHCGAEVNSMALHGLSCRWSEGRHHRHAALNNILVRAFKYLLSWSLLILIGWMESGLTVSRLCHKKRGNT